MSTFWLFFNHFDVEIICSLAKEDGTWNRCLCEVLSHINGVKKYKIAARWCKVSVKNLSHYKDGYDTAIYLYSILFHQFCQKSTDWKQIYNDRVWISKVENLGHVFENIAENIFPAIL